MAITSLLSKPSIHLDIVPSAGFTKESRKNKDSKGENVQAFAPINSL